MAPPPEKTEPIASMALAPSASAPVENAGANLQISSILSSLMKSGLVSAIDTSSDSKVPPTEQEPKEELEPPVPAAEDLTAIRDARMDYHKRILAERSETLNVENDMYAFDLTQRTNQSQTRFLSDDPTNVSFFLYDYLPLQCQQRGIRFLDTILGKKQLEEHLDLHFRQNHKLSQNPGRGHDRSWFTSVEVTFDTIDDFFFLTHLPGLGP